jgi:hypothetical protein
MESISDSKLYFISFNMTRNVWKKSNISENSNETTLFTEDWFI